jgi:eukaryotic-like serine/threonine-protein kinase
VATSTLKKRGNFWRADWFVGVLVVLAVLILHQAGDLIGTLERRFYDFASTSTSRQPSDKIAVIAIDDTSIANIGRWPWSRDVHAQMTDLLSGAKAKVIANTTFFFEPQTDRGLQYIRKIKDALNTADPTTIQTQLDQAGKLISEAEATLDTDAKLAASISKAGNVVIPSVFKLGEPLGNPDKPLPEFALKSALDENAGYSIPAISGQQPIDMIGNGASAVGHLNSLQDRNDGSVREEPLLVNYYGKAIPSMALMVAAKSLNLKATDIKLNIGDSVQIGKLKVKTDDAAVMLPQFYKGSGDKRAFPIDSFYDVLTGKIPASKYADKIVIIGATAAGVGNIFPTPAAKDMSPAETIAHVTSSILGEHFIVQPAWGVWISLLAFLLVAGYLIAALPRLSAGMGAGVTAAAFIVLLGIEFGLLAGAATWLKLVLPAALLLIGHLALTTKRFLVTEAGKAKSDEESAETNRMMGLALAGQGRLDEAFDRYRRVPASNALLDNLGNLALDFERKRQFNKAQAVYEHMGALDKNHKGLQEKLNRAKNLSETVILGGGGGHPGGTLVLGDGSVEKPMLGRYQVEKELGKGAMGVVYLGKDPKIGRVVAIKTMALSQEFDGDELTDARERFFREAETAGRLQHPQIVTIYDAGEEHDLAYIAMEFLKGKDLLDYCKDGNLLPMQRVVSIVERVASALAYAHKNSVVHRDIKPANVMYEHSSDTVKVTDFGIARITDSSKTKTGLVLGTPSFMSPEQIAGKKVDGRSDLYSLGVMLFQMLAGVLPFRGESMAELMYKIANEEAPDIRIIRSEIPQKLADVVAMSLSKRPETRYQDGDQFAADLRSVMGDLMGVPDASKGSSDASPIPAAASHGEEKTQAIQVASPPSSTADQISDKTQVLARSDAAPPPAHMATDTFASTQKFEATKPMQSVPDDPFEKTMVTRPPSSGGQ